MLSAQTETETATNLLNLLFAPPRGRDTREGVLVNKSVVRAVPAFDWSRFSCHSKATPLLVSAVCQLSLLSTRLQVPGRPGCRLSGF